MLLCLMPGKAIAVNMSRHPVLGPADSGNTRSQWLEGEIPDKALSAPPNSRSQSVRSMPECDSQLNLEELAASSQYFRERFGKE